MFAMRTCYGEEHGGKAVRNANNKSHNEEALRNVL